MKRIAGHIKKLYIVYALLAVVVAGCIAFGGYIKYIHADDQPYNVADEVVINGKTYTSENKMKVLMIAPDEAYDELGILIGDDKGSIKFNDIKKLAPSKVTSNNMANESNGKADYEYRQLLGKYQSFIRDNFLNGTNYKMVYRISSKGNSYDYDDFTSFYNSEELDGSWNNISIVFKEKDGNSYKDIAYRNIFAAIIFDNYNMDDKMEFDIKSAASIEKSDIEKADLIYISKGPHINADQNQALSIYNKIHNTNIGDNIKYTKNNDLKAEDALYLMKCYAKGEKRVILDTCVRDNANCDSDTNIRKIGYLFTAIDPEVFLDDFMKVEKDGSNESDLGGFYSYGTKGSIKIVDKTIKLYYKKDTSREIKFAADMFINSSNNFAVNDVNSEDYKAGYPENNKDRYPYYNATSGRAPYVNAFLYVYNGDNSLTSNLTDGTITMNDYVTERDGSKSYRGSTYQEALDLTGSLDSNGNKVLHPANAIEYILGLYNNDIASIKVLEIEPMGTSRYDNPNGKKAIASWFGLNKSQYDKISDNIIVDSYSMNAFNGLNADIRSDYDLVIIGAYDDSKLNKAVYTTPYDTGMSLSKYELTGNDITQKAYEKIYSYVAAGMPLVLDDGIYYNSSSIVDEDCSNLKNLQAVNLKKRLVSDKVSYVGTNIVHTNTRDNNRYSIVSKTVSYVKKPSVDIGPSINGSRISDYVETKGTDGKLQAERTVNNDSLSDIHFTGSLSGEGTYRVKIYVDRNNDSLFSENYTGQKSELVYYEKNGSAAVTDTNGNILGAVVNSGSFDVAIPLPVSLRGYIKWRVEVTDVSTGAVKNSEGAFAVSVNDSKNKTIQVLQIENDNEEAHINLNGSAFRNTFNRTTPVTGLDVHVDVCKKSEFNKKIEDNPDYLSSYSMLVLGFSDNYGNDLSDTSKNLSDAANDAIYEYIQAGNSVLYTHDSMSYRKGSSDKAASSESEINSFTKKFKDVIGMKSGFVLTDTLKLKLDSKYTVYNNVSASYSTRTTKRVKQLNSGQITEYPYTLSDTSVMSVSETHAQYYQLDLEKKADGEDVVVWYTLTGSGAVNDDSSKFFIDAGQDAVNNYYAYSIGNITYTSAGHSNINSEGDEMELFVNTFVRALLAGNNPPEVEYEDAEKIDDNNYAIYYRQRPSTDSLTVTYTVTDIDLVANAGQVAESYIYYDIDGDGKYTEGTDLRIGYLDKDGKVFSGKPDNGGVYCGRQYSLTLWSPGGVCSSTITSSVLSEMKDKMANGTLTIGIVAIDESKAIGYASLQIAYRPLFNLN